MRLRKLLTGLLLTLFPLTILADLTISELKHACSQLVEQEKSWFESLTTSREEAFLAGRCEGAIKAIVDDSRFCYLGRGELVAAAKRIAESSSSRSVPKHIRVTLDCER